ncbi:hypothetical protein ACFO1B_16325 [Dactylosporangium siamense]|uniref:Uncharacterized protein n=1 Tax=Dactylosporangium siamense TaxID=685454 RepID=A0A919PNJ9_9ACTN|nr:hypothetical protein [Dactylosporangium siamense]GIG45408.1 hypothetical protein Dsi01nite_034490 [Dactylosporangium siamense]
MPLDELRTTLNQAAELDEPPVGGGPAAVFARADRTRSRQRIATAVSGIVVLGVVIGVAATAVDRSGGAPTAAPAPVVSAGPPSAPTLTSAAPSPRTRPSDVPADAMLNTLLRLLPAGVTVSEPDSQPGFAEVILSDRAGRGKVQVNVQPGFNRVIPSGHGGDDPMDTFTCARRRDPAGTHCTRSVLPDGTIVVLTEGPSEDAGHDRIQRRMADVYRPDGVRVVLGTWNAVHEKTNTATRAEPPLTVQQLQAIATDPTWPV